MKAVKLTPGDYVVLNLVIVTLVVVSYLFMRKGPRPPVTLNLKNPMEKKDDASLTTTPSVRNFSRVEYRPRGGHRPLSGETGPSSATFDGSSGEPTNPNFNLDESKSLNVLFNWNGHTWDAYEVLDIPAGSSRASVEAAFERMKHKVDPESVPFVTAAFQAIVSRK